MKKETAQGLRTILIFIIQAYESAQDTGQLNNVTTIELIDSTYDNAEKRARQIVKKPFYRLAQVIEKELI